ALDVLAGEQRARPVAPADEQLAGDFELEKIVGGEPEAAPALRQRVQVLHADRREHAEQAEAERVDDVGVAEPAPALAEEARRIAQQPEPRRDPGQMPRVASGLGLLRNPTRFFSECRRRLGDTYVVDAFGFRLFCVFSPVGVQNLYALPESRGSFGLATYNLLKLKIPGELFVGRRNGPRTLFAGEDVER